MPPIPTDALRGSLGEDLAALLAGRPARVVSVTPITSLSARRSNRASFRVGLADGTAIKARRFDSNFEAARFARLTRQLNHPLVPAAIARRGAAVIEPWTEGHALSAQAATPEELRACGALLGAIHGAPLPKGSDAAIARARSERLRRLEDNLEHLLAAKKIDTAFAARARSAAIPTPAEPSIGLIHGDFCPDNLVRTAAGEILSVDNETMRFEALDYDLARCWYRWPMTDAQAHCFLYGYATQRPAAEFLRHFSYWAICALVDSAVFRNGAGIAGVETVLERLAAFVRERPSFPAALRADP